MKKIVAFIICLSLLMNFSPVPIAVARDFTFEKELAWRLEKLGIVDGVSEGEFALDGQMTRIEALIMVLRLIGKEEKAQGEDWCDFKDVPEWAKGYVGYAASNGITYGISKDRFDPYGKVTGEMFVSFVVRALGYGWAGYNDEIGWWSSVWQEPFKYAEKADIFIGNPDMENFCRADAVLIAYAALGSYLGAEDMEFRYRLSTLAKQLIEDGIYTKEEFENIYVEPELLLTFGKPDSSGAPKQAFYDLAAYILNNRDDMNEMPTIGEDVGVNYRSVRYDKKTNEIIFSCIAVKDKVIYSAEMHLEHDDDTVRVELIASPQGTGNMLFKAKANPKKADVKEGMKVELSKLETTDSFNKSTDNKPVERVMEIMSDICCMLLIYPDELFKECLPQHKNRGVIRLGFTNYKADDVEIFS